MSRFLARAVAAVCLAVLLWGTSTGVPVCAQPGQSSGSELRAGASGDDSEEKLAGVPEPRVDLSGLDAFWTVADTLAAGRSVADAGWEMLFSTPGYRMLSERYPLRYPIVQAMKLTFDPRRTAERESVEGSSVWMRPRMIRHFRRVRAHRDTLRTYRRDLAADDSLMQDAMALLRPHVPAAALTDRYPPLVAFVLFLDDGYASPDVVAIDLWMAQTMGRDALARFIAHELFHAYRSAIARPRTDRDNGYVTMLVGALEQLENEGIADRIDKPALLEAMGSDRGTSPDERRASAASRSGMLRQYVRDYRAAYARAPETVRTLDRHLARLEERQRLDPGTVREVQRAIPMGGHPTGAFMADVIAEIRGEETLRGTVGDVFAFLHTYHDAARHHAAAPALSEKTLAMLDRLDRWTTGE